jgi:small-conductance mechanosensitive channel
VDLNGLLTNEAFKIAGHSVQIWSFLAGILVLIASFIAIPSFQHWLDRRFATESVAQRRFLKASTFVLYIVVAVIIVNLLGIYGLLREEFGIAHKEVSTLLDLKLFAIGKSAMTLWTCIYVFVLTWVLIRFTEKLNAVVTGRLLSKTKLDRGFVEACATSVKYCVMVLGASVILQTAGVDLSALSFVAGAAGIAIGLGLQALMNNVVSGLVILVDRPIRVGDRIDIGGVNGEVSRISLRATTVMTNDGIAVIVPNSQFISTQVVNWTYMSRTCRFKFPLTTARTASPALIQRLLTEVAQDASTKSLF